MITEATIDDVPQLVELWRDFHIASHLRRFASYESSVDSLHAWFTRAIEHPDMLCLLAVEGEQVVGFFVGGLGAAYWNPAVRFGQEFAVWVAPGARGLGYGTGMIELFSAWAQKRGAQFVGAGSASANEPKAIGRLLRRLGFTLEERIFIRRY